MNPQPTPEERDALLAALNGTGPAIVCYATCWPCKFGHCYDPPQPHPWWGPDDVEHAQETGQEPPSGDCACPCARPTEGGAA